MSHEIQEGTELLEVVLPGWNGNKRYVTGTECQRIVVKMQPGDMSMVPWAEVLAYGDRHIALVNLANAIEVTLKETP